MKNQRKNETVERVKEKICQKYKKNNKKIKEIHN